MIVLLPDRLATNLVVYLQKLGMTSIQAPVWVSHPRAGRRVLLYFAVDFIPGAGLCALVSLEETVGCCSMGDSWPWVTILFSGPGVHIQRELLPVPALWRHSGGLKVG